MDEVADISEARRKKKPKAAYADYIQLFTQVLGELKRDVFTGDLHFYSDRHRRWLPVFDETALGRIRSFAREKDFYNVSAVDDYIQRHTFESSPQLLIDLHEWDGQDRIAEVAACLKCNNLDTSEVYELLCDWGAKMFRRLYDPIIQNRILVIKGRQGLGKDFLVKQMLGGLGQYLVPFVIHQQERDTFQQLISGLVMVISEYDRTNRTEVSALKNMITADRASFRGAYERKPKIHMVRSSFIATCNVDGILRDWTGNRRYIIFDVADIERRYPLGDTMQVLAQWRKLSSDGYRASEETESKLAGYIDRQTPADPEKELIEDYQILFRKARDQFGPCEGRMLSSELGDVWKELGRLHDLRPNTIKAILKRNGFGKHTNDGTKYWGEPVCDGRVTE